jgi:hypothetical protein
MTSALSILRAFAELVAGTDDWTNWSMEARAALEAAAKAPGLGESVNVIEAVARDFATGTGCRICDNRTDGKPCAPCKAYAILALRAIDTYLRGERK